MQSSEKTNTYKPLIHVKKGASMNLCPCGSSMAYADCCEPIIKNTRKATTALELMRARYSAYSKVETDFIRESLHPDKRATHDDKETFIWASKSQWDRLEIRRTELGGEEDDAGAVEFIAYYSVKGERTRHHEVAQFVRYEGEWVFEDGIGVKPQQIVRDEPKVGRNDPCPCNSGKKFKKCCGAV